MDLIYLDYNATTPVDPAVLKRMTPFFDRHFGNPSSKGHAFGWAAAEAVEIAREELAELIAARPEEITFTAGATESLNIAIQGIAAAYRRKGKHVVTATSEHSAVHEPILALERDGFEVTWLPVDRHGRVATDRLAAAITEETVLVAVMWANNETGAVNDIAALSTEVRDRGALFLTDATQAVGKIPVSVKHADVLACSAHKFYGPKGVGALWLSPKVRIPPLTRGGGQEEGLRSGTLNVPGIVGMGAAASVARDQLIGDAARLQPLRDRLETELSKTIGNVRVNAAGADRLPQTSSITFEGVRAANMLAELRGLALSAGSACSSGTGKPSRILKAMGLTDSQALSTIRFSLGRFTTEAEIETAIEMVIAAHEKAREQSTAVV